MIDYFRNKQLRVLHATPNKFVRKRYVERLLSNDRLIGLIGQRGVGKTTALIQYLKNNFTTNDFLYFSADDIYIANTKLYNIADEFVRLGGKVLVIDEIHLYQNWSQEIKNIYDTFPELRIRFSGSAMLKIEYEKYDLSRRCVSVYMDILTFNEYLNLNCQMDIPELNINDIHDRGAEIGSDLILAHPNIYSEFKDYLRSGAYPFFMEDKFSYKNKLFNALQKIINEDIPSCKNIEYTHISLFKKLIAKLIESRLPYKVNVSKLSAEMGMSHPTMMSYLNMMQDTKIFRPIKKYSKKISVKPEKLLFHNTNILHAFADDFGIEVNIDTQRETFFAGCFSHIYYSDIGDFRHKDMIYEIGGKNKSFKQIKNIPDSKLVIDTDYTSDNQKIPLWLFGMITQGKQ